MSRSMMFRSAPIVHDAFGVQEPMHVSIRDGHLSLFSCVAARVIRVILLALQSETFLRSKAIGLPFRNTHLKKKLSQEKTPCGGLTLTMVGVVVPT